MWHSGAMETTNLREALTEALKRKQLTQTELADMINTAQSSVSRAFNLPLYRQGGIVDKMLTVLDLEVVIRPRSK